MAAVEHPQQARTALVLTGGGARAAYQVGVLRAIAEMTPKRSRSPFAIVCGTSAGAVNAAAIATDADDFRGAVRRLVGVWKDFHAGHVYRADLVGMARCAARWLLALGAGGLGRNPVSLLDNAPLGQLLARHLDLQGIQRSIDSGALRALAITASGYSSGHSISFFQGHPDLEAWQRARRIGTPATIGLEHLMASAAIPFMFPPMRIGDEYFGDGSMRQIAPLSPALHLGAERVLVISVSRRSTNELVRSRGYPSVAQIAGHALNSIFTDGLEADLERLDRTNRALARIRSHAPVDGLELKHVDCLVLSPSEAFDRITTRHLHALPRTVRYFLRGIGATRRSGSNLASYVLFERPFCRALMRLGYDDTMARRDEIAAFLDLDGSRVQPRPLAAVVPAFPLVVAERAAA